MGIAENKNGQMLSRLLVPTRSEAMELNMARKIRAANELYHKIMGTIDTIAKFEAKRAELAWRVWLSMQQSGSRECGHC